MKIDWRSRTTPATAARYRGFTLVELLVVIAIIGVMVGLLLPAVQAAREAARRMSCSNNQKQISLAMHNYSSAFNSFPYGWKREVTGTTHRRDTWFHRMLPFVEQQAFWELYERANTTLPFSGTGSSEYVHNMPASIIGTTVPAFMCPSDPAGPARGGGGNLNGFQGNYAVCAGGGTPTTPLLVNITALNMDIARPDAGGMFGQQEVNPMQRRDFRDCNDGTSNVLMLSEGIIRGNTGNAWGELGGYNGGAPHGAYGFSSAFPPNTTVPDRPYTCKSTTFPRAPCENGFTDGLPGRYNFARSYHPGGVLVALMDASVRFVSNSVDRDTFRNAGNRADGAPLAEW